MSKLDKIRTMLQSVLSTFERISTDKALLDFDGDELEVGMNVRGVDEEGNYYELENGEYRTEDGTIFVIEDGKVTEIREDVLEEPAEEPSEEPAEEPVEETAAEEEPAEEPEAEPEPEDDRIANLEAEIARLEEENGALREENDQLKERIAELENKPAAEPAAEEFEKVNTTSKTGDKKIDNLIRRFSK